MLKKRRSHEEEGSSSNTLAWVVHLCMKVLAS